MINIIRIKNAVFYAYHGVFTAEQSMGGKFEIDADIYTDFREAAMHDDLKKTINYASVYELIRKFVTEKNFKLIESLSMKVADGILEAYPSVSKVAVRVRKQNVPVGGYIDCAEIEVVKDREEFENKKF